MGDERVTRLQNELDRARNGDEVALMAARDLARDLGDSTDPNAVDVLIEALSYKWANLVAHSARSLGRLGAKKSVPQLASAFEKFGYIQFQQEPQLMGSTDFGSYRDKIIGLCEAIWMLGDPGGLEIAKRKLREHIAYGKRYEGAVDSERALLRGIESGEKFSADYKEKYKRSYGLILGLAMMGAIVGLITGYGFIIGAIVGAGIGGVIVYSKSKNSK